MDSSLHDLAATIVGTAITLHQLKIQFDRLTGQRGQVARLLATDNFDVEPPPHVSIAQLQMIAERMNVRTSLMHRLDLDKAFVRDRVLRIEALLEDVGRLAAKYSAPPFVVVEHASSFFRANLPLGLYDSGDVDLLSSPRHIGSLERELATLGYRPYENSCGELRRVFHRPHATGEPLEVVVWLRPVPRHRLPEPRFLSFDDILEIAEPVENSLGQVLLLPPTYDLLYHCLHASLHSYFLSPGLRIYLDIDRVIAHTEINWSEFVRFSKAHNLTTRVAVALRVAQELLSTDVPRTVFEYLTDKLWTIDPFASVVSKLALYPEWSAKFPRFATIFTEGFTVLSQRRTQLDQK